MHSLLDEPGADSSTLSKSTRLTVRVVDSEDAAVLGNVFFVLTHQQSKQKWIDVHYNRAKQVYLFKGLTGGAYSLRVNAVGYETDEIHFTLEEGTAQTQHLRLRQSAHKEALIFAINEADYGALEVHPASSSAVVRLIVSLMNDHQMLDAMTRDLSTLPEVIQIEAHLAQRLIHLGFPYEKNELLRRHFWKLIDARARLTLTLSALFSNPDVAAYLEIPPDADIAQVIRSVVDGFDVLDIDRALLALAQIHSPWRFIIEEVARSQPGLAHLLTPPGIALSMSRNVTSTVPVRPARFQRGMAETTLTDAKTKQQIVQLVQALVGAYSTTSG